MADDVAAGLLVLYRPAKAPRERVRHFDLRPNHFFQTTGRQPKRVARLGIDELDQKVCIVGRRRVQAARRPVPCCFNCVRFPVALHVALVVVGTRHALPIRIAARGHPEWDEEVRLHVRLEVGRANLDATFERLAILRIHMAGQMCYDGLQVAVAFAGIVPALAWREMNLQRVSLGSPVLESAGVREDVACRDQIQARITLEKSISGVLGEGRIEIEYALLARLHDDVGEDSFAHRRRLKDGVVIHWSLGCEVRHAKRSAPQQFSISHEGHRHSRDCRGLRKQWGKSLLEIGDEHIPIRRGRRCVFPCRRGCVLTYTSGE